VPLNYARHALRGLTLWLLTLPFCLVRDLGLLTGPTVGIMAWLLFGVYQIGYTIEDPFQSSLELPTLCDAIRKDVLSDDLSAYEIGNDDGDDEEDFWQISNRDHRPLQIVIHESILQEYEEKQKVPQL
jgi:predicted membrane chloride channel (bestrophin family)